MPQSVLCQGVLRGEYQLVTRSAAGNVHHPGEVPATVELTILVEVQEVLQQLLALGAGEAGGVPALVVTSLLCKYSNLSRIHLLVTAGAEPDTWDWRMGWWRGRGCY